MTTLSIALDDAVARRLAAHSADVGKTPEAYAGEVLSRLVGLDALRALAEDNARLLRAHGYTSEGDVREAIREGVEDVRGTR